MNIRAFPIRFTRFGTFYILFSIGVGAGAINTGNNLLYLILGILLGFIVISGFLSDSGLWGVSTQWAPLGSLYAGQMASFDCRVSKGWFPGVAVMVESEWQNLPTVLSFASWIPARGTVSLRVELQPARRGMLVLERCRYSTRFPFGLFQKTHARAVNQQWIVYPRLRKLPSDVMEWQGRNASLQSAGRSGHGSAPFALRDYRPGDGLRQVSWKSSAKRQRLIIKEMEEESDGGDLLYLRAWPQNLSAEALEDLISYIASLIVTLYQRGRPIGLQVPERYFKPEHHRQHLHRLLEFLALVNPYATSRVLETDRPTSWGARVIDIQSLWTPYARY